MKIAVIGAGIAGLSCAWLLSRHASSEHQVTLFEQNDYLGGHTNTVDVTIDGITYPVDTGFLVFNDWTYPNLIAMFKYLGVEDAPSDMSFSVKLIDTHGASKIEWSGSNLATVFAQPANLLRPAFLGMVKDIVRFNRQATEMAASRAAMPGTLGEFLDRHRYGQSFRHWYLMPMAACVWSTPTTKIDAFPLATFLNFCHNHGLLSVSNRPQWSTVKGGARNYVTALAAGIADVRTDAGVVQVTRTQAGASIVTKGGQETFDHVVFACHTDQTLRLLSDGDEQERDALTAIPYQSNTAILHTDASLLPVRKRAWASWNYHAPYLANNSHGQDPPVSLSYLINRLQSLPFSRPVIVTMNPLPGHAPDPAKVIKTIAYDHPVFLAESADVKRQVRRLQGKNRAWFAGAWTRYGFHEDGLMSGIAVAQALGAKVPWATNVPPANDLGAAYPGVDG